MPELDTIYIFTSIIIRWKWH